tara:strand:+ start:93 stop:539 length:447 start_codon:yes stop_codon:yes gene_type:complete
MTNKTFKGQLADGEQRTIRLSTNNGLTGYKIKKLQIMIVQMGGGDSEHVVQVFSTERTTTIPTSGASVTFEDPTLLGCAMASASSDARFYPEDHRVIFDDKVINQDIFITHTDNQGSTAVNYYIELEKMKLDINEATVATLKDMRGRE